MRSRSPAKSLLFGGVSLILFCLVFETASRIPRFVMYVRGGQVGAWAPETFRVYDIGPTGPRSFFRTQYKVERLGFRGKAPPLPGKDVADPGTLDVFCIGDSVTFGHGSSSDETTYPAYLEAWLKNRGRACRVYNAGTPSYISSQVFLKLHHLVANYRPDVVIIHAGWNDITAAADADYPLTWMGAADQFGPPRMPYSSPLKTALACSALFQIIQSEIAKFPIRIDQETFLQRRLEAMDQPVARTPVRDAPRDMFRRNIEGMIDLVVGMGAQPILIPLTTYFDPRSELTQEEKRRFRSALLADLDILSWKEHIHEYNQVLRNVARDKGVPVVETAEAMKPSVYYLDLRHLTDEGNAVFAGLVGEVVLSSVSDER